MQAHSASRRARPDHATAKVCGKRARVDGCDQPSVGEARGRAERRKPAEGHGRAARQGLRHAARYAARHRDDQDRTGRIHAHFELRRRHARECGEVRGDPREDGVGERAGGWHG